MSAYSSERSDPIGQASCSDGNSLSVLAHHFDHGSDVDRAMLLVPAVIIGDHGYRRVGDLGFPRQFRLGRTGHANDVRAACLKAKRLRKRRKLRAFDANVGPTVAAPDL